MQGSCSRIYKTTSIAYHGYFFGLVQVPCDRCLESLQVQIQIQVRCSKQSSHEE